MPAGSGGLLCKEEAMKYYLASGVENAARVNAAAKVLDGNGHERTYDWTVHGSVARAEESFKTRVAETEAKAVAAAETVIVLLPGAKGTHAELGMALAGNVKRVLIWSETASPFDGTDGYCVFYHHPKVERFTGPFEAFLEVLKNL